MSEQLTWRMRLVPDETAPQTLKSFQSDHEKTDKGIIASAKKREETLTRQSKAANDERLNTLKQSTAERNRMMRAETEFIRAELEKQTQAHQRHADKIADQRREFKAQTKEMNDGLIQSGQGLVQLGAGFAEIGLASAETSEALLKGLVRIQGVLDVVEGTVNIFRGMATAVELFSAAQTTAAAITSATSKANAAAVTAEAAAWANLAAAKGAAGIVGVGGAAAGGAIIRSGGGAAERVAGSALGAGSVTAASKMGLGGRIASMARTGAAYAAPAAAGTAAAVGGVAGGVAAFQFGRDVGRYGFGGGATPGSFSSGVANSIVNTNQWLADRFGGGGGQLQDSRQALARMQAASGKTPAEQEAEARRELQAAANAPLAFRQRQVGERRMDTRLSQADSPGEQKRLLADAFKEALADRRNALAFARSSGTEAGRSGGLAEVDRLTDRLKTLAQARLDNEREILRTARETSRERQQAARDELKLVKDRIKSEQDRFKSAAERFGQMDRGDQLKAQAAMAQARRFGAGSLSRDQSAILRNIGTADASEFASQADIQRANQAGFGRSFGSGERRSVATAQAQVKQLTVQVQTEQKIQAELKLDEEKLARQTAQQVLRLQKEQEQRFTQMLQREIDKAKLELANASRQDVIAQRNLAGS